MPNDTKQSTTSPQFPIQDEVVAPNLDHVNSSPVDTTSGSAAPTDDVVMPPVTTTIATSVPKKKFAGGKVIATILGLFLLVGGVGAGVYLTGQNQNISKKADSDNCSDNDINTQCAGIEILTSYPSSSEYTSVQCGGNSCIYYNEDGIPMGEYRLAGDNQKPFYTGINCPTGTVVNYNLLIETLKMCEGTNAGITYELGTAERWGDCCRWDSKANGCDEGEEGCCIRRDVNVYACYSTATSIPATAQCQNIKAYSTNNWTLLTSEILSTLRTGDSVNFCVTGSATDGSFDKARFTINGVLQTETTTVRPSSTDFCQLYVIPADVTTFDVSAEIHHITLGWK